MDNGEAMITIGEVDLCAQAFGDPGDPAVLLVHGAGNSLVSWPKEFCQRLAGAGRRVIRYDSRDAGRSTTYEVGAPPYALRDLATDAVGLLDALGITRAHVVGMSQGAAVGQLLALDHTDRVASLTLASSTPGGPGHEHPDLPPMAERIQELFAVEAPEPDWSDRAAMIEYLVEAERPFTGTSRPFDADGMRAVAALAVDRAANVAAQVTNPFLLDAGQPWRARLGEIRVPTLVVHGREDPMFPFGHAQAMVREIPGSRLLAMAHTGHEVFPRSTWDEVVSAIVELGGPGASR